MAKEADSQLSLEHCPVCGGVLDGGFILGQAGLVWSAEKKIVLRGVERLVPVLRSRWLSGQRCRNCRLVLFRY